MRLQCAPSRGAIAGPEQHSPGLSARLTGCCLRLRVPGRCLQADTRNRPSSSEVVAGLKAMMAP